MPVWGLEGIVGGTSRNTRVACFVDLAPRDSADKACTKYQKIWWVERVTQLERSGVLNKRPNIEEAGGDGRGLLELAGTLG